MYFDVLINWYNDTNQLNFTKYVNYEFITFFQFVNTKFLQIFDNFHELFQKNYS